MVIEPGEDVDITINVQIGESLEPNIFIDEDSFGGYGFMEYKVAKEIIEDGERRIEFEKIPVTWGTNWDIRDANTAIDILNEKVKEIQNSPYIAEMQVVEAFFVNPAAWGE